MQILVVNGGSSSIKFKVFDRDGGRHEEVMGGLLEKIGLPTSILNIEKSGKKEVFELSVKTVEDGFTKVFELFTKEDNREKYGIDEVVAIGHRVVHGLDYKNSVLIDDEVYRELENNLDLAPLHNPAALAGVKKARESFPGLPNVAVFDTSFHQTMPKSAYLYPISLDYFKKHKVRRYGFHGISHQYISNSLAEYLSEEINSFNAITCHLGNGCSMAAIKGGQSIDTTMGFTPLEGLMMGTRSGSIDPAIISYLCQKEGKTVEDMTTELNKKSGLLAIGGSNDMRDIEDKIRRDDQDARLAFDMFTSRIKKQIGAYVALLEGDVDALIFSGGIGENDVKSRLRICEGLGFCGFEIDADENAERKKGIHKIGPKVYVVPTNEEWQICKETIFLSDV